MAMINLILYGLIRRYRREKSFLLEMRLVDIIYEKNFKLNGSGWNSVI
jgi:hypothetical protein